MSFAAIQRLSELSRAQLTVLAWLQARRPEPAAAAVASSREIAASTGLSRRTVQPAIDRLNELQFIRTLTGAPTRPSEHFILLEVTVQPPSGSGVPVGGGAIGRGAVEKNEIAPPHPGAIPQGVRGAIVENSATYPQSPNKEDARANTPLHSLEKTVSVSTFVEGSGKPPRRRPEQQTLFIESAEILRLVEVLFETPLPTYLRVGFSRLAEQFRIPELSVMRFLEEKWVDKLNTRRRIFSPAALLRYAHEDLAAWIPYNAGRIQQDRWFLSPERKPSTLEVMPPLAWPVDAVAALGANA